MIFTFCTKGGDEVLLHAFSFCVFYTHRASFAACAGVPWGVNGLPNAKKNAIPERMAFFLVLYFMDIHS